MQLTKTADKMITKLVHIWEKYPAEVTEPGFGYDIWDLAAIAGIISKKDASIRREEFMSGKMDDLPSVGQYMKDKGWIKILHADEHGPATLCPTVVAVDYVKKEKPWITRFLSALQESARVIFISIITSAIITVITYFILKWLNHGQ